MAASAKSLYVSTSANRYSHCSSRHANGLVAFGAGRGIALWDSVVRLARLRWSSAAVSDISDTCRTIGTSWSSRCCRATSVKSCRSASWTERRTRRRPSLPEMLVGPSLSGAARVRADRFVPCPISSAGSIADRQRAVGEARHAARPQRLSDRDQLDQSSCLARGGRELGALPDRNSRLRFEGSDLAGRFQRERSVVCVCDPASACSLTERADPQLLQTLTTKKIPLALALSNFPGTDGKSRLAVSYK